MSEVETAQTGALAAPAENTAATQEQTQETASAPAPEQVDPQRNEPPRDEKGRFVPQERVNEITRARREAERGWQSERQLREQLESRLAQLERHAQPATPANDVPTLEQYNNDPHAWAAAVAQYSARQVDKIVSDRLRETETQNRHRQITATFEERSKAYASTNPDYEQRLYELDSAVQFQPEVVEAIAFSEHGPAVAHYLAQHLDEADRIARLPAHLAAVQLGRIEAQVSAPKLKPVTSAPAPVPTVGGGSQPPVKDPSQMTDAEWYANRLKR